MEKNILIIGSARSGKTTLAKKLVKEKGYSLLSIDHLVSGFEAFPELKIRHDDGDVETATHLAPFLIKMFIEMSEGNTYYDGIKFVIEGTHIDFEQLMPFLQSEKYQEKYKIIGLTYNDITEEEMYNDIRKHDTEDDWTYWCKDEELRGNVRWFIKRNSFFASKFAEYGIKTYDTSHNREEVFNEILNSLEKDSKKTIK